MVIRKFDLEMQLSDNDISKISSLISESVLKEITKLLRPEKDILLSINDTAKTLGISRQSVYNYYHNNIPPFCNPIRLGKRIFYKKSSILEFLDKNI